MKILGMEVIRVVKGMEIYREHHDTEFAVNDTEEIYDNRYLHHDFSTGEIEKSTYYILRDARDYED